MTARHLWLTLFLACSSEPAEPHGACTFENAAAQAYQGVAPGLKMCLGDRGASTCDMGPLRSAVANMPTREHKFVAGKRCEDVGYERCATPLLGVEHYRPCDGAAPAASSGDRRSDSASAGPAFELPPAEPGPVYVALRDGVGRLLPDGTVGDVPGVAEATTELRIGGDGHVYAASTDTYKITVWRLEGDKATRVGTAPTYRETALAVAADGTAYVAADAEVYRLGAKRSEKLPAGPPLVDRLAFDAEGRLVATSNARELWLFADDAWKQVALPDSSMKVWLVGTGASLVVAQAGQPLATLANGALVPAYGGAAAGDTQPVLAATGVLAVNELRGGTSTWRLVKPDGTSAPVAGPDALPTTPALDAAGRLWFVVDGGLSVVPLRGGASGSYPIGSLPILQRIGNVTSSKTLLVLGAGPTQLPQSGPVQVVEHVTATLRINGAAVADAGTEICTSPVAMFRTSPCENDSSRRTARTDASGAVTYAGVPVGTYQLAMLTEGRWALAQGAMLRVEAGASGDLGALDFTAFR